MTVWVRPERMDWLPPGISIEAIYRSRGRRGLKILIRSLKRCFVGPQNNDAIRQEIFSILRDVYRKMLPVVAVFAGISLLASLVQTIYGKADYLFWGFQLFLFLLIISAALFLRHLSSLRMFTLILAIIYVLAVASLINRGLAGSGIIHMIFFCVFSGLFLGVRKGLMLLAFSILTIVIIAFAHGSGYIIQKPDAVAYLIYPANWIIHIACIVMYTLLLILAVKGLHEKMISVQVDLKENNRQLATEISTRRETEKALTESEAKYRSVVENSVAGFFIVQNGLLRFVNQRCCDISGYPAGELRNNPEGMDLIIHPDDRKGLAGNIEKCLATKAILPHFDVRLIRKDGEVLVVLITLNVTAYENAPAVTGVFIDITREKQLEAALNQAQKMEAIGQLAGGIAHDFNNILTVFSGYSNMLQMKMSSDDPLKMYVDQMLLAAQKGAGLIQNLLIFSRQQPITIATVDINRAILNTEKLLKRLLTEDITFTLDLSREKITALVDVTQLDRILFNLVSNARDAMPRGGTMALKTGIVFLDDDFRRTHGFGKSGRYAYVSMTDSGMGMDKSTLEKIFNPFFTTKATGHGTGLGLATVYAIVKQHYGFIVAESVPGHGTTFHIYLPYAGADEGSDECVSEVIKTGTEKILIADDNDEVRSFFKDALDMAGYEIIEAVDGNDALEKYSSTENIDLVILDSVMPKRNGREVYNDIVKVNPSVKALFISGYTRDVVLNKGISSHEARFLLKPVSFQQLLDKVREVLDEG